MKIIDDIRARFEAKSPGAFGAKVPVGLTYSLVLMPSGLDDPAYDACHLTICDPSDTFSNLICAMNLPNAKGEKDPITTQLIGQIDEQ